MIFLLPSGGRYPGVCNDIFRRRSNSRSTNRPEDSDASTTLHTTNFAQNTELTDITVRRTTGVGSYAE